MFFLLVSVVYMEADMIHIKMVNLFYKIWNSSVQLFCDKISGVMESYQVY